MATRQSLAVMKAQRIAFCYSWARTFFQWFNISSSRVPLFIFSQFLSALRPCETLKNETDVIKESTTCKRGIIYGNNLWISFLII